MVMLAAISHLLTHSHDHPPIHTGVCVCVCVCVCVHTCVRVCLYVRACMHEKCENVKRKREGERDLLMLC